MTDPVGRPTASSSSAGARTETGASPAHWSDRCFLCGVDVGEADPRQFYGVGSAMVLCHTGCLNVMNANGGSPVDYHRAMEAAVVSSAVFDTSDAVPPTTLDFPDFKSLQQHLRDTGDVPGHVRVTVGGVVVQSGR